MLSSFPGSYLPSLPSAEKSLSGSIRMDRRVLPTLSAWNCYIAILLPQSCRHLQIGSRARRCAGAVSRKRQVEMSRKILLSAAALMALTACANDPYSGPKQDAGTVIAIAHGDAVAFPQAPGPIAREDS